MVRAIPLDAKSVSCAGLSVAESNLDFSVAKLIPLAESKRLEFRADFFNLFNHANRDNPISDINSDDFGRVVSFSSSPRIVQLSLRFDF